MNGLKHGDFKNYDDGILQSVSTSAEGAKAPMSMGADGSMKPLLEVNNDAARNGKPDALVGANVFGLFDTSTSYTGLRMRRL